VSERARKSLNCLRKRAEFLAVAASGRKWVADGLILQIGTAPSDIALRYGLTASGKVGNAVKRNRARRRLRALAGEILSQYAAAGHDYVLIARGTTVTRTFADLRGDLTVAMKKLGVWKDR
jgi:ribonuclease P protein component